MNRRRASPQGALPRPGTVFGAYPLRGDADSRRRGSSLPGWRAGGVYRDVARRAERWSTRWQQYDDDSWARGRARLAGRLAREGLNPTTIGEALGCVAAHARRHLGIAYFPTQFQCAAALLDQRLVEMATGEGKTLAAALAAAAAALSGIPVHVLTANDYLARRDADELRTLYGSLGLTVAAATESEREGPSPYDADVVYATAKTVAFDFLRDRAACPELDNDPLLRAAAAAAPTSTMTSRAGSGAGGDAGTSRLRLRGLCMAIIDEADSILIDEAQTPLILSFSRPDPDERARLWQALDWAGRLRADVDYVLEHHARRARLTDAGRETLARDRDEYRGFGLNDAHREELIEQALTALHLMRRGVDYMLDEGEVLIVDAVTGRSAPGRVWSRGLHGLVALKEGLDPPDPTSTLGRTLYPSFFRRYHHLCGLSGTLREVRTELRRDYALRLFEVPLRRPCLRRRLPDRVFADRDGLFDAALQRAIDLVVDERRAVLLTTDSIQDTQWFADRLARTDVPHAVLNAATAEAESAIVAQAGASPRVTIATQMAGRGTDIALSDAVRRSGGLHVLNLQHNRSRRVDRQIAGRAARQGSPGSYEHWRCLEAALRPAGRSAPSSALSGLVGTARRLCGGSLVSAAQWAAESEDASLRRRMFVEERKLADRLLFSPHTE